MFQVLDMDKLNGLGGLQNGQWAKPRRDRLSHD